MKNIHVLTVLLVFLVPSGLQAGNQKPETNVNSRYTVESAAVSGISPARISKSLHEEMQKLVGEKYNPAAAREIAAKLRRQLPDYRIAVQVKRGDKTEHVKVIYVADRMWWKRFEITIPPVVYHSKQGMSGSIEIPIESHHNVFTFGAVNSADELLERNAGFRFRYEHRKVGTDRVQLRIDFDTFHQKWNQATERALATAPEVPGIYRWRQDFAPSVSVIPIRDLKLSVGTSFQRFQTQYPDPHTETAYAGTAGIQYRHRSGSTQGFRQDIRAGYNLRTATRVLDSDFIYTRHAWTAQYSLTKGNHLFGAQFEAGVLFGRAPLFERFSLGDSTTLRGWNKFDVAPIGGSRSVHGSLEYRYRPFQIFYDVGKVWDPGPDGQVRHGLGFGLAFRNGGFMSLACPVRLHHVVPVFMLGFRF